MRDNLASKARIRSAAARCLSSSPANAALLRCSIALEDVCEMFLQPDIVFSYEPRAEWKAELAPV